MEKGGNKMAHTANKKARTFVQALVLFYILIEPILP
jgi:hypothetical protein